MIAPLVAFWMEIFVALATLICCLEYFLIRKEFKSEGLFGRRSSSGFEYGEFLFMLMLTLTCCFLLPFFPVVIGLLALSELYFTYRFNGSFNGGSGSMSFVLLVGLSIYEYAPLPAVKSIGLLYVGIQCLLSFLIAGGVKLANPDWRRGIELGRIMRIPSYAVPLFYQSLFSKPKVSFFVSWLIILFEVFFFVGFLNSSLALLIIVVALIFNFFNMVVFGLNRFLLFWLAAYPALFYAFTVMQ